MSIRLMNAGDASAMRELWLAGLREVPDMFTSSYAEEASQPLDYFAKQIARGASFGCWDGEALGGMVAIWVPDKRQQSRHKAYLGAMYVAPQHRGKGVAKALIEAALEHAKDYAEQVSLGVSAHNAGAIRLYESLGFTRYALEPRSLKLDGRYIDEVLMVKFL